MRKTKTASLLLVAMALLLAPIGLLVPVHGQELITPESDFVQSMVEPAVAYLKKNYVKRREYGNAALIGLAIYNAGLRQGKSKKELLADPVLKEILSQVAEEVGKITPASERRVYSACVAGLLLAEVDDSKYQKQINHVLDLLYKRQMTFGAWSYVNDPRGDTSQTQYASLFLWMCQEKKFKVKELAIENAIKFLIATQHPSGGFVYKASPGLVQGKVTQSLTAAGLGSIYLLGDAFGLHGGTDISIQQNPQHDLLPPSVTIVADVDKTNQAPKPKTNIAGFDNAKQQGDAWFRRNFAVPPSTWTYYFLYGYERYSSFRERAENISPESPTWYVEGAKFLHANQNADGSWQSENSVESTKDHSTAFAILFLVRSTKLIVPTYVGVAESGQRGLPESGPLTTDGRRVVAKKTSMPFDKIMSLMESELDVDWNRIDSQLDSLILSKDDLSQATQLATLRKLLAHENAAVRRIAVNAIGRNRDFENVPALILALSDPETEIASIANEGLRFVSRKFDSPKLSDQPNQLEMKRVIDYWTEWYMDVVPDGMLIDLE